MQPRLSIFYLWILQDVKPDSDYFASEPISAEKAIVFLPSLLELFEVCRLPGCGGYCDPDNRKITYSGAMVSVTVTCNSGHHFNWKSSPTVGQGKNQVSAINVLLGTYGYLCGINVKKVTFVLIANCCSLPLILVPWVFWLPEDYLHLSILHLSAPAESSLQRHLDLLDFHAGTATLFMLANILHTSIS